VTLCINVLFRKQYVEHERLSFPLTAIPLALTEKTTPLLRRPVFWLGLAVPLLAQAPITLNRYIPSVPAVPLREVLLIDAGRMLPPPWNGLGEIYFSLIFWLVGIVYWSPRRSRSAPGSSISSRSRRTSPPSPTGARTARPTCTATTSRPCTPRAPGRRSR
jgi:hypothetical protein